MGGAACLRRSARGVSGEQWPRQALWRGLRRGSGLAFSPVCDMETTAPLVGASPTPYNVFGSSDPLDWFTP
jgi:hypothetical protein